MSAYDLPEPQQNKAKKSRELGIWAEQHAKRLLQNEGYEVLAQNYHSRYGEIDLIAVRGEELIFVEVKARSKTQMGQSFEVITPQKQLKIFKTALKYIQEHADLDRFYYRFDVICFDFKKEFAKNPQQTPTNVTYDLQWIENAFTINADFINL
ncbi:YraN family protein [Acinetobacter sp. KS-LM10]|uniref:YraN family protein n=1 Tax=Acinetobacter sp. KS-LM10 TaxID=3120518 RepID=UPI0030CAE178